MPLYEYQCSRCEKVTEVMQKFSDAPLDKCPECGGTVSKLVSLGSFALKGTGWYTTDYKRAGVKPSTSPAATAPVKTDPAAPATPTASSATSSVSAPAKVAEKA